MLLLATPLAGFSAFPLFPAFILFFPLLMVGFLPILNFPVTRLFPCLPVLLQLSVRDKLLSAWGFIIAGREVEKYDRNS
jgi:hypothetical protein